MSFDGISLGAFIWRERDGFDVCAIGGHDWQSTGGRSCHHATTDLTLMQTSGANSHYNTVQRECSMPVFRCRDCGVFDYGEWGGPGWKACTSCPNSILATPIGRSIAAAQAGIKE